MRALSTFLTAFPGVMALALALLAGSCTGEGICYDTDYCCIEADTGESKGDPHNCTIYYVCLAGNLYAYECTNFGKPYYDVERMTCDSEENVPECLAGTRPPDGEPDPSTPSTSTITTTIRTTTTTTTQRPPDDSCTEPGIYLVPFPGNCSLYMICANFELLPDVFECPEGTLFDPTIRQCNLESEVECAPECPPTGVINLPDERNCSRYWLCAAGTPSHQSCAEGLKFDPVLHQCNVAHFVFCPNLCPATGVANFPHDTDCTKYWLCANGTPALQECAPGLIFDPTLGQCVIGDPTPCSGSIIS